MSGHIVAMGGGGFSMEPDNLALDRHVLALAGKARPKISFVATASGDADGYIARFYEAFRTLPCEPSHLGLFRREIADLAAYVAEQDVIYVGGGNTYNMLALWRLHGLDVAFREAWQRGAVLAGVSAGALCWFEGGTTDSFGELAPMACLGFLGGSMSVHYDGEEGRRPLYHRLVAGRELPGGWAADDGTALCFAGETLTEAVTSRRSAGAYRVEADGDRAVETVLPVRYIGP